MASLTLAGRRQQPDAGSFHKQQQLRDEDKSAITIEIPDSMADALDCIDPAASLMALSRSSQERALELSTELLRELTDFRLTLPEPLQQHQISKKSSFNNDGGDDDGNDDDDKTAMGTCLACSDSIFHSLTKIATGGSAASHEIRLLEQEKRELEDHAAAIETALSLRSHSDRAAAALQQRDWMSAAQSVRTWLDWKNNNNNDNNNNSTETATANEQKKNEWVDDDEETREEDEEAKRKQEQHNRCRAYAGEYSLQQMATTYQQLKTALLSLYETAVQESDLQTLGTLTPVLSLILLDKEAVRQYLEFLKTSILEPSMSKALEPQPGPPGMDKEPAVNPMARVYNTAVAALRHHLPMVSHCLYKADGDAAVVQLVHVQVEQAVLPLLTKYSRHRQLHTVSRHAVRIYDALEERNAGRGTYLDHGGGVGAMGGGASGMDAEDCGFAQHIGSLADVDAAMEETALCMQHAESYGRFMQHTTREVNKARRIRFEQELRAARLERERQEWASGKTTSITSGAAAGGSSPGKGGGAQQHYKEPTFQPLQILPVSTQLQQQVAELGGQYASIERCLLLASMQRAFSSTTEDARYYRPLNTKTARGVSAGASGVEAVVGVGAAGGNSAHATKALQTSLVETCFYAARRGTQRAFCTGHTGTASAMTNFCVDCLQGVLLEVMSHRAEELGVNRLKPGEGLLVGSAGALFHAGSALIRQGASNVGTIGASSQSSLNPKDELLRKQKLEASIARACAAMNDLEVAVHHTEQLESVLRAAMEKGFAPDEHETEQLRMCVKALGPVRDGFRVASDSAVASLESVLKPRVRSMVTEAVGAAGEASGASGFMATATTSVVMGAAGAVAKKAATNQIGGGGGGGVGGGGMIRMNYNLDEESYNLSQLSEGYVARLATLLDEQLEPLRVHLAPRLWDSLLLTVLGSVAKRLETFLRKCQFTSLGALTLDADVRDVLSYAKERLHAADYGNNVAVTRACPGLGRLQQIARLLQVDDLEDVLDLISQFKRKGQWDLKLEDAKAFLCARVEFEPSKVNELLRLPDDD